MTEAAPYVSMIVATHERPDVLRVTLASLAVQQFKSFEVLVVHEPTERQDLVSEAKRVTLSFGERFRFLRAPERWNDFGNTAKWWATEVHARGNVIGHANGDNYYCPTYLSLMVSPFLDDVADFTYCNYVTHYLGYRGYSTAPTRGHIDGTGWLCRKDIVLSEKFEPDPDGKSHADSWFAERIAKKSRVAKLEAVLWMHN